MKAVYALSSRQLFRANRFIRTCLLGRYCSKAVPLQLDANIWRPGLPAVQRLTDCPKRTRHITQTNSNTLAKGTGFEMDNMDRDCFQSFQEHPKALYPAMSLLGKRYVPSPCKNAARSEVTAPQAPAGASLDQFCEDMGDFVCC